MRILVLLSFTMLLITSCSTIISRQEFHNPNSYATSFNTPVDDTISIKVSIGSVNLGNQTRMMPAGTSYVNVPTGQKAPSYSAKNKREYQKRLANLLVKVNAFKTVNKQVIPDYALAPVKQSQSMALIVRFNSIYVGEDGWPTDIEATFILKKAAKILFQKDYSATSGFFGLGACWDCYPEDVVEKKLNEAFLKDLLQFQQQNQR